MLSITLMEKYGIPCVWQTHAQLEASLQLEDAKLVVQGREIAVVYYRSAYTPADYPSEKEWEVRKRLELTYPGHYDWQQGVSEDMKEYKSILIIKI